MTSYPIFHRDFLKVLLVIVATVALAACSKLSETNPSPTQFPTTENTKIPSTLIPVPPTQTVTFTLSPSPEPSITPTPEPTPQPEVIESSGRLTCEGLGNSVEFISKENSDAYYNFLLNAVFLTNPVYFGDLGIKTVEGLQAYIDNGNLLPPGLKFIRTMNNDPNQSNSVKLTKLTDRPMDLKKISILFVPYDKLPFYGGKVNPASLFTPYDASTAGSPEQWDEIGLGFGFVDNGASEQLQIQVVQKQPTTYTNFPKSGDKLAADQVKLLDLYVSAIPYFQRAFCAYPLMQASKVDIGYTTKNVGIKPPYYILPTFINSTADYFLSIRSDEVTDRPPELFEASSK